MTSWEPTHVIARITIERFIESNGKAYVRVESDDMNGGEVDVVEALGLLQLATWDVSNRPAS
jgi:hypothetical protein